MKVKARASNRNRVALVLACLAASTAMLLVDGEDPEPIASQQSTANVRVSSDARRTMSRMNSSRPPDAGDPASRSKSADVQPSYGLSDEESLDVDASIADLTTVALSDADPAVREEAVYALGEIGGEVVVEVLKHALFDANVSVREAAVEAFADIGGEQSALALAVVLKDADASLRTEVVDALGEIGGPTAIRLLRQAAMDEQSAVRAEAADLLAELSGITAE